MTVRTSCIYLGADYLKKFIPLLLGKVVSMANKNLVKYIKNESIMSVSLNLGQMRLFIQ